MNWNETEWDKEWNHMTCTVRSEIHNLMLAFCHIWGLDMPKSTLPMKLISSHTHCSFLWGTDPPSWRQLKLTHSSTFVGYICLRGMFWKRESWKYHPSPISLSLCDMEETAQLNKLKRELPFSKYPPPFWLYLRIMHLGQNGGLENFPSSPHRMVDFLGA